MKSKPLKWNGIEFRDCEPKDATHLRFHMPGPTGELTLPVMIGGTRAGTPNWTWNGDTEKPTLKPSIKTTMSLKAPNDTICHSFLNDGKVEFLSDCTYELSGKTLDLLEINK